MAEPMKPDALRPVVSRHRSDVVGCAQPSERSARRIAQPIPSVLASDATPRCASMASADRQMIGDATLACRGRRRFIGTGMAATVCAAAGSARARDDDPARPVTVVVPYAPSVASRIRCRRLRAAIGAQRKAHRLPIPSCIGKRCNAAMHFDGQRRPTDDR
ncbi:hypothetical protein Veis_1350 [Verminephrobacter eiseniae EF01-2]|uniref:Uncharacterized protein n=1 Tax=Verminephrobacter eiseniae (strain EF01-2) TaxID=391735 RepID=A1WHL0_VEREI|nr:hypothetical protein Veis_1350 [Verminephrobacter eiseniae EF01-2]